MPGVGRVALGEDGGRRRVGAGHTTHLPPAVDLRMDVPPRLLLLRCPSRRSFYDSGLSGSVPSQLGRLTALTYL